MNAGGSGSATQKPQHSAYPRWPPLKFILPVSAQTCRILLRAHAVVTSWQQEFGIRGEQMAVLGTAFGMLAAMWILSCWARRFLARVIISGPG